MIVSLKHRGLRRLYEKGDRSGVRADLVDSIEKILTILDAANGPKAFDLPRYHLHPLKGDRKGQWAVTVRANWRVVFRFEGGHAHNVDLVDYH